jgi:heme exporter protein B
VIRPPSFLTTTWLLLRKDLLLEWRTKARLNALVFFSLATLLLFSFALGPDSQMLARNAGGYYWLAILFASVLSLGESFRVEQDNQALDGVRLVPASPRAVFLAKAIGNAVLLFGLSFVITPVMIALYGVKLTLGFGNLVICMVLGCLAISAPGTLYAAIASNARARDVLLPLLLFPLLIPALLSAAKSTALIFEGDPMTQLGSWWALLVAFNLIYWALGFALFPKVIED